MNLEDFTHPTGPTCVLPDSPIEIFRLFFTIELIQHIVDETNRYAYQCMGDELFIQWQKVSICELEAFFGFMMLMGLVKMPSIRDYWKKDNVFHYIPIASRIPRVRFFEIQKYLHFTDNSRLPQTGTPGYNKLGKIETILNMITERFESVYNLHRDVSIDEAMIRFKGRSTLKQYLPLKPIKRGIKVWVLADSKSGYVSTLDVYKGKGGNDTGDGLGAAVVKNISKKIKHR